MVLVLVMVLVLAALGAGLRCGTTARSRTGSGGSVHLQLAIVRHATHTSYTALWQREAVPPAARNQPSKLAANGGDPIAPRETRLVRGA
jgi:hypothetical protein